MNLKEVPPLNTSIDTDKFFEHMSVGVKDLVNQCMKERMEPPQIQAVLAHLFLPRIQEMVSPEDARIMVALHMSKHIVDGIVDQIRMRDKIKDAIKQAAELVGIDASNIEVIHTLVDKQDED